MARPPRRTVRKAPGSDVVAGQVPAANGPDAAGDARAPEVDAGAILAEFESALRDEPGIGQEGLDFLMPFLRDAVEQASLQPARAEVEPAAWMSAFDALVGDALEEGERNALVRQLNEAVEPFSDDKTKVALEFAKRVQSEGQASALAWLEEQKKKAEKKAAQAPPPVERERVPVGAGAITRSRSRRLRGPPA